MKKSIKLYLQLDRHKRSLKFTEQRFDISLSLVTLRLTIRWLVIYGPIFYMFYKAVLCYVAFKKNIILRFVLKLYKSGFGFWISRILLISLLPYPAIG